MAIVIPIISSVSDTEKIHFTKHLTIMMKSGVPLIEALVTLRDQTHNIVFRSVIGKIIASTENGQTLEQAFAKHPRIFNPLYLSLVKVGERSGNLEINLEYIANHMKKAQEFKKRIQNAMMYPMVVFAVATLSSGCIAFFVLPKLIPLFSSLGVDLPLTTRILLAVATISRSYGVYIAIDSIVLLVLFCIFINLPKIKPVWHAFLLRLPILGLFLQNVNMALFCYNLGLMLQSGLPIATALQTQENITTNLVYKRYATRILAGVDKGKTISSELQSNTYPFFPLIAQKMINVGEKTGKLDESMLYLGAFYEEETDGITKNLATLLEPLVLFVIALIVLFIALAIITPIYQLTGSIRR